MTADYAGCMATTPTPTLTTERLTLVPLRPEDADELFPVLDDPALHGFTGGVPLGRGDLRRRFEQLAAGRSRDGREAWHNWVIRERRGDRAVGTVQATVMASADTASVAWVVGVPWQGRGYATEAATALVAWLASLGLGTIEAHVHPDHAASATVAARAGLSPTDDIVEGERVWRWTAADRRF